MPSNSLIEEIDLLSSEEAFFSETLKTLTGSATLACFEYTPRLFADKRTSKEHRRMSMFFRINTG